MRRGPTEPAEGKPGCPECGCPLEPRLVPVYRDGAKLGAFDGMACETCGYGLLAERGRGEKGRALEAADRAPLSHALGNAAEAYVASGARSSPATGGNFGAEKTVPATRAAMRPPAVLTLRKSRRVAVRLAWGRVLPSAARPAGDSAHSMRGRSVEFSRQHAERPSARGALDAAGMPADILGAAPGRLPPGAAAADGRRHAVGAADIAAFASMGAKKRPAPDGGQRARSGETAGLPDYAAKGRTDEARSEHAARDGRSKLPRMRTVPTDVGFCDGAVDRLGGSALGTKRSVAIAVADRASPDSGTAQPGTARQAGESCAARGCDPSRGAPGRGPDSGRARAPARRSGSAPRLLAFLPPLRPGRTGTRAVARQRPLPPIEGACHLSCLGGGASKVLCSIGWGCGQGLPKGGS